MLDVLYRVSDYVSGVNDRDIPDDVVAKAKSCVLDNLGCALLGSGDDSSRIVSEALACFDGGEQATVVGRTRRTSPLAAALVNATLICSTELSEGVARGIVHPGTVVIPAALAEAEARGADGADALRAAVLGYEVLIRLGRSLTHAPGQPDWLGSPGIMTASGWFPPAVLGSFGAAVAVARLRGLDAGATYRALGLCANLLPLTVAVAGPQGAMAKPLAAGWSSALGLYSVDLAQRGLSGLQDIPNSVLRKLSSDFDESLIDRDLGSTFEMRELGMKWIAAGPVRSELECALQMRTTYQFDPLEITDVRIDTNARTKCIMDNPMPESLLAARFSAQYCVAQALLGQDRSAFLVEAFTDRALSDKRWRAIASRIRLTADAEFSRQFETYPNIKRPSRITISMRDGRVIQHTVEEVRGNSVGGIRHEDYVSKFRQVATPIIGAAAVERVISEVDELDSAANVAGLMRTLAQGYPAANSVRTSNGDGQLADP